MKVELEKDFFREIPSEFTVDGVDVQFKKRYPNQFTKNDLPAIVVYFVEEAIDSYIYFNKLRSITNESTDYLTFEDGKYVYELEFKGKEILKVEKLIKADEYDTVGDYWEPVDDDSYFLNDDGHIEFQEDEESVLDDGREFRVNYEHQKIKVNLGGEFLDRIQVDVVTSNRKHDYDDSQEFVNGIMLKKEATRRLMKEFRFGFQHPDLVVREVSEATDLSDIEGEDYHYRNSFDVEVAYHETYTRTYDSIEEIDEDILEFDINLEEVVE